MKKRHAQETAIINGASSGIGDATALALAKTGNAVVIFARRTVWLKKLLTQKAVLFRLRPQKMKSSSITKERNDAYDPAYNSVHHIDFLDCPGSDGGRPGPAQDNIQEQLHANHLGGAGRDNPGWLGNEVGNFHHKKHPRRILRQVVAADRLQLQRR
jgi:hypothetical protein